MGSIIAGPAGARQTRLVPPNLPAAHQKLTSYALIPKADAHRMQQARNFKEMRNSIMRFSGFVFALAALASVFAAPAAFASPAFVSNDPCKVLTAEKFSQIMGYTATIDKTASTASACFYQGPPHSGGQFMILTETASGPQADAMLNRRGATPPAGSGLIGGAFRQGSILFSVSIRSTDKAKLDALVAEIKRNLK
jgi:hypothetical protein